MDAWSSAGLRNDFPVYTGLWTNWSQGRILGATLTLTKGNGALVIAFAAFFVTIVGARFWRIACIIAHHVYCRSNPGPRDVLYHQRQAILRNSSSAISGLWVFIRLIVSHHRSVQRLFVRAIPILLFSLLSITGITVLTYFLPQIITASSDQVLLRGDHCGLIRPFTAEVQDYDEFLQKLLPYLSSQISSAENYAQQCYSGSSQALQCSAFVSDRIPSTITDSAECPFQDEICRLNATNIKLDTGLVDLDTFAGLNTAPNETLFVRRSLHCAPLRTEGYTSHHHVADRNYTRYHYGPYIDPARPDHRFLDATMQFVDIDGQYPHPEDWGRYILPPDNYQLSTLTTLVVNGTVSETSDFNPISELQRTDADIMLSFLSGPGVHFLEPSPDPWYRATTLAANTSLDSYNGSVPEYRMDEPASPLGCAFQWQFCQGRSSEERVCGDLASFNDAKSSFWQNAINRNSNLLWYLNIFHYGPAVSDVLITLQSRSLTTQRTLSNGIQTPIPQNQWQLDVAHWWATVLAAEQAYFIDTVTGPPETFSMPPSFIQGPKDGGEREACRNQKVRSAAHSSFNMLGLASFFVGGTIIILLSLVLEPMLAALHARRGYQQYAYLEWISQETLQLQRLAHEELGFGTWTGARDAIPTTKPGEKLACLDTTDPKHPRLQAPVFDAEKISDTPAMDEADEGVDVSSVSGHESDNLRSNNRAGGEESDQEVTNRSDDSRGET